MTGIDPVDGLSIEQVGQAFGVSRATSARMLAAARAALVASIRERLRRKRVDIEELIIFCRQMYSPSPNP